MGTNIKKSIVTRVRVAFLGVSLFAAAIVYKIVRIQYAEGDKWRTIAKESRLIYQPVFATRGSIYADDGKSIMATSLPFYRVAFDATICDDKIFNQGIDSLALLLARFYQDKSPEGYRRKIKNARGEQRRYLRLHSRQINYQEKKMMAAWPIFRAGKNKGGVIFEKVDKRFRPFGSLAQRTVGRMNEDGNGSGLEFTYNRHLAGKDGEALFERMAGGNKPIYDGTEIKPLPGYDIKTTIDINLQDVAENALYKALVLNNAQYGCVILMEVKTGQIKAIANLGKAGEGVYVENYNYAVGDHGRTEPGSTFKLASMMALFEDTDLTPEDTVDTGRGRQIFGGVSMGEAHGGGYGKISISQVFEKSSNVGTAKLIETHFGKTPERYIEYLQKFGIDKPLGFQLHGEAKPYIRTTTDRGWSRSTLSRMAIGYGLKISPLQTLAFYNAVANNGIKVKPMIVQQIRKADAVVDSFRTENLGRICSEETAKQLRSIMEAVVEKGTGKQVKNINYKVAGKTGTSWKTKNGQYIKDYSTSFAGYFPADNPKYSCIIIIDTPKKGRIYGGDVAAPVFRELADKAYVRDLAIHKPFVALVLPDKRVLPPVKAGQQEELTLICNRIGISTHPVADQEWIKADSQHHAYQWKPVPLQVGRVPDVSGMTLRDALFLLGNQGLKVQKVGVGRVQKQSLEPGSPIQKGSVITLILS